MIVLIDNDTLIDNDGLTHNGNGVSILVRGCPPAQRISKERAAMRRLLAAVLAALAVPALALLPAGAASATPCLTGTDCNPPQPDGSGGGWTLVENDNGQEIYDATQSSTGDWMNVSGDGGKYCDDAGQVGFDASLGALELTTDGNVNGNCARVESTWTVAPPAGSAVWIEYEATLPTNTWAALWATGYPLSSWPTTGEIDTAEMLGTGKECHTYHYGSPSDPLQIGPGDPDRCENGTPGSEAVYGVEWSAGQLTFYVNGAETDQFTNSVITADPEVVMLDNKTGGFDSANGTMSTLDVYYVRVWECELIVDGVPAC
jgi:hypothetical protein